MTSFSTSNSFKPRLSLSIPSSNSPSSSSRRHGVPSISPLSEDGSSFSPTSTTRSALVRGPNSACPFNLDQMVNKLGELEVSEERYWDGVSDCMKQMKLTVTSENNLSNQSPSSPSSPKRKRQAELEGEELVPWPGDGQCCKKAKTSASARKNRIESSESSRSKPTSRRNSAHPSSRPRSPTLVNFVALPQGSFKSQLSGSDPSTKPEPSRPFVPEDPFSLPPGSFDCDSQKAVIEMMVTQALADLAATFDGEKRTRQGVEKDELDLWRRNIGPPEASTPYPSPESFPTSLRSTN